MEPKEPIAPEASDIAPKNDDPSATPAEQKEAIDPRIVEIVGEEQIQSAYGEQPEEEGKPAEDEKKEEEKPPVGREGQEEKKDEEVEIPPITPPESKPSRLDRRLANRYVRNLILSGEKEIPSEEDVIADLKKYSKEEKIQALHFHLQHEKKLRGESPTGDLEEEDREAIQDAEKESIRQEILAEEYEKKAMSDFITFVESHPELDEEKKEYDSTIADAVETLWKNGMTIDKAYETITKKIEAVKEAKIAEEKKAKTAALSGAVSGVGQVPHQEKALDWDDVAKIQQENPAMYNQMLRAGKFAHLR